MLTSFLLTFEWRYVEQRYEVLSPFQVHCEIRLKWVFLVICRVRGSLGAKYLQKINAAALASDSPTLWFAVLGYPAALGLSSVDHHYSIRTYWKWPDASLMKQRHRDVSQLYYEWAKFRTLFIFTVKGCECNLRVLFRSCLWIANVWKIHETCMNYCGYYCTVYKKDKWYGSQTTGSLK